MKLPSAEEYLQIVDKRTPGALATLYNHRFILHKDGTTLYQKSRNNIIFKTEYLSKSYAVRFFLNDDEELFRRYRQIQTVLDSKTLSWKVPFRFMNEEYYPVLLIDWIDSLSLTGYLDQIINDPRQLTRLQQQLVALSRELERNGIGHGNLNMKHIRFVKQEDDHLLKLLDYDSMFIPSFQGKDSFGVGTSGFQHPVRLASDFSEKIDRFSFWIMISALETFKTDPSWWKYSKDKGFNKETQILFTYRDLAFPDQSTTFQLLRRYDTAALNFYVEKLKQFCSVSELAQIEAPRLYEEKSFDPVKDPQKPAPEPKKIRIGIPDTQQELIKVNIAPKRATTQSEAITSKKRDDNDSTDSTVLTKPRPEPQQKPLRNINVKEKRKKPVLPLIVTAMLLLSVVAYFAWNNGSKKQETVVSTNTRPQAKLQQPVVQQKEEQNTAATVFTTASITQFLFQLYQSYNKRNLASILSNYSDNLNQYYDAGAVSKNKLNGVIKNLFIKPAYYECHPDLTTLKFSPAGDSCTLSISINETIKADRRSRTENYSSKTEYVIDSSFKIIAERSLE